MANTKIGPEEWKAKHKLHGTVLERPSTWMFCEKCGEIEYTKPDGQGEASPGEVILAGLKDAIDYDEGNTEWARTHQVNDIVNHPSHYTFGKFEVIDVIEDWNLGYHLGNVIKYVARAKHKDKEREDLQKAQWYLNRYLEKQL